ncbi:hypothetical protein [Nisaea nitritireducens]|uniref:hypothetical protein n=1 Tax=Nisaea nitritireducens TaxID=568392 RepID=UPI00186640EA|nr:hypothetical protein [Nisaea nitritireducens]
MEEREEEGVESIEPTPSYFRAKRNVVLSSSLLIISIIIGIKSSSDGKVTIFPIVLEDWKFIDEILCAITAYFFLQTIIYWAAQGYFVRNSNQYRYDFYLSVSVSCVAFFIYFVKVILYVFDFLRGFLLEFDSYFYDVARQILSSDFTAIVIGAAAPVTAIITARYIIQYIQRNKSLQIWEHESLNNLLISEKWILHFNPISAAGEKEISFEPNGKIGVGANQNEATWRLRGAALEILNSDNKIFSRFFYDPEVEIFQHTNDDDTLSLSSQWIEKNRPS